MGFVNRKSSIVNESGFGRAVSRILSAQPFLKLSNWQNLQASLCLPTLTVQQLKEGLGRESFVSAADTRNPSRFRETWSGPLRGSLFGLAPDGVFRASSLALRAVRSYRTFSPLPPACAVGGLIFCGTIRRKVFQLSARVYLCFATVIDRRYRVTRHRALWCSDFPPPTRAGSDSPPFQNHRQSSCKTGG